MTLTGKKTYLVGITMIIYGVAGAVLGKHGWDVASQMILAGLGFMGLRAGISTDTKANGAK